MALLDAYAGSWGQDEASHLARRAGFGASPAQVTNLVSLGMSAAVDSLVNYTAIDAPLDALIVALPSSGDGGSIKDPTNLNHLGGCWIYRMVHSTQPFQQQYALFLHNRLVSELDKVATGYPTALDNGNDGSVGLQQCNRGVLGLPPDSNRKGRLQNAAMIQQNTLFTQQGHLGYINLIKAITRDTAMLIYLDNWLNRNGHANENYGREVMELFTMGVGNYTENDVRDVARAFTGETIDTSCASNWPYTHVFNAANHDTSSKTVFGTTFNQPGSGDTDYVLDLIMNRVSGSAVSPAHSIYPAASLHTAWKMLVWFVSENIAIGDAIVSELANQLYNNQPNGYRYDMREAFRKLFKSQFFYDPANRYTMYKHPADYIVMALRNLGIEETNYTGGAAPACANMGMQLFNPPNVAGWHVGQAWVNSSNTVNRFNYANRLAGSSLMTDAYIDGLIPTYVANFDDNAGIIEYFRARLIQTALLPAETAAFNTFFTGISAGPASQSQYRRKVRGALHLMMTMPRYQLK